MIGALMGQGRREEAEERKRLQSPTLKEKSVTACQAEIAAEVQEELAGRDRHCCPTSPPRSFRRAKPPRTTSS